MTEPTSPLAGLGGQLSGVQVGGVTTTLPDVFQGSPPPAAALGSSASTAAPDSVSIQAALDSLSLFEAQFEGIHIVGSLINSDYDANGTLYDTIDLQWEIVGRPGVFTTSVPFAINWQAIAFFYIGEDANKVELIYEGAASLAETPTVLLTQPPSSTPPTPIPRPGQPVYV